jgi:hypothetical protein
VQCPYHGWEFDNSGTLIKVPSLTDGCGIPTKGNEKLPTSLRDELFYGSNVLIIVDWIMNGVDYVHDFANEDINKNSHEREADEL